MNVMADDRSDQTKKEQRDFIRGLSPNQAPFSNWMTEDVRPLLTSAERDILFFINHHTYGYGKFEDYISYDQFQFGVPDKSGARKSGTFLGLNSIKRAIKVLVDTNVVVCTRKAAPIKGVNVPARYEVQRYSIEVDFEWLRNRHEKMMQKRANGGQRSKMAKSLNAKNKDTGYDEDYEASLNVDYSECHG